MLSIIVMNSIVASLEPCNSIQPNCNSRALVAITT